MSRGWTSVSAADGLWGVLKRHLSDVIYRALNADARRLDQSAPHAA